MFTSEFQDGKLKCFFCTETVKQVKRHFEKHREVIKNWDAVENFCHEIAARWKREANKRKDTKRAGTEKRKETLKKKDAKCAGTERSKETQKKKDAKRAGTEKRKQTLKKIDEKRAGLDSRKELRKLIQMRYLAKLGDQKKKAQNRKYQQS